MIWSGVLNCNSSTQSVFTWFSNHARTQRKMNIPGMKKKVTFEKVMFEQKKDKINKLHKSLSKGMDVRQAIGLYSVAKKQIKEGLTAEEEEEYERIVVERQGDWVPLETQIQ